MKKEIIILFAALLCIMSSCTEKFGYTHLDGMWQVQTITKEGVAEHPEDMYFSFQMHIVEIRKLGYAMFNGTFDYTDGTMTMEIHANENNWHLLPEFGMNAANKQVFEVEKLTNSKLILQSDYARVELRKY